MSDELPNRRTPAHPPPLIKTNQSSIIFLTVCVRGKRPLLATSSAQQLLVDAWRAADFWLVGRYVVMPDHVHLFCAPATLECRLQAWISCWRNQVTRNWPQTSDKPIWQRDYWDTQLRRGESYSEKWEYVRMNPVRAGLVATPEMWPYAGELHLLRW